MVDVARGSQRERDHGAAHRRTRTACTAQASGSTSASAIVRGSSSTRPSWMRAMTGGSVWRRAADNATGSASGARTTAGPSSSVRASAPPPGRDTDRVTDAAGPMARQMPLRPIGELIFGVAEHAQGGNLLPRAVRVAIEHQGRLERGQRELVDAQRPSQRLLAGRRHRSAAADEQAGLRSAQQLVARAADHRRAGCDGAPQVWFRAQRRDEVGAGQGPGAHVIDDRNAELAELLDADLVNEAQGAEVRLVDPQDRPDRHCGLAQGTLIVAPMGAVRRPDLDHRRAGLGDHVGDAKPAADLDLLAPGDHDPPARAPQGRGGQEYRSRAVVDHHRRFTAGQLAQQSLDVIVPRSARPVLEVELEVAVARRHLGHGPLGALAQGSAAQVGVHEDTGGVDHPSQGGGGQAAHVGLRPIGQAVGRLGRGEQLRAPLGNRPPGRGHGHGMRGVQLGGELVDGWKGPQLGVVPSTHSSPSFFQIGA